MKWKAFIDRLLHILGLRKQVKRVPLIIYHKDVYPHGLIDTSHINAERVALIGGITIKAGKASAKEVSHLVMKELARDLRKSRTLDDNS